MFGSEKDDRKAVAITINFNNGESVQGYVFAGVTGKLADAFNKPDPFVEFSTSSDQVRLIAKSSIASVTPAKVIKTDQLTKRMRESGIPNPYTVLGVQPGAGQVEIQNAYHSLARRYHPDHFSGREIPPEVLQYVSAMFQRITSAYNELKKMTAPPSAA